MIGIPRRRLALEIGAVALLGLLPAILIVLPRVPIVTGVLMMVTSPGFVVAAMTVGIIDQAGLGNTWVDSQEFQQAVGVIVSVLLFGSAWYVVRTHPTTSRLRFLTTAFVVTWVLFALVSGVLGGLFAGG